MEYVVNGKISNFLNIDGSDDPFYRYKVRQLRANTVGKGYKRHMIFANLSSVANNLKCHEEWILKWFAVTCGLKYSFKKGPILYGDCDAKKLSTELVKFISMMILCPKCNLPELSHIKENGKIRLHCNACGRHGRIISKYRDKQFEKFVLKGLRSDYDMSAFISGGIRNEKNKT